MWELKVVGWWVLKWLLLVLEKALTWLLYVPMTALQACFEGREAVEWAWLLACTDMRLARRRRLNFREEVGDGQRS